MSNNTQKKRKRNSRHPHQHAVVKAPALLWEAWNLGFLNAEAEIALQRKFGSKWHLCYGFAAHMTEKLKSDTETHIFENEQIASMCRMVGATGVFDRGQKVIPEDMTDTEFDTMLTTAWRQHFSVFFSIIKPCSHINLLDALEQNATHYHQILKKESLSFVSTLGKSPCRCCPPVTFTILGDEAWENRCGDRESKGI